VPATGQRGLPRCYLCGGATGALQRKLSPPPANDAVGRKGSGGPARRRLGDAVSGPEKAVSQSRLRATGQRGLPRCYPFGAAQALRRPRTTQSEAQGQAAPRGAVSATPCPVQEGPGRRSGLSGGVHIRRSQAAQQLPKKAAHQLPRTAAHQLQQTADSIPFLSKSSGL
jgi:hypothetical protein